MANNTQTADLVSSHDPSALGIFINVLGPGLWMAIACGATTLHAPDNDSLASTIRVAGKGTTCTEFSPKITSSETTEM
jgi:hypothetical protein